jgi:S-DNA-T family DNA segregation ATPase FtsK/SpoIIIE
MAKNTQSVKNNKNSTKQQLASRVPQRSSKAYVPKTSAKHNSVRGGLWRFITSKWVRRLLLLATFLTLLAWQWNNLALRVQELAQGTYGFLGWGLLLILVAVIVILCIIFRQKLADFIKRYKLYLWHKWLGAVAFFFAAWGILGLFSLGGIVGQAIIGEYAVLNVLRVLGLIIIGIILVAPGTSWRVFTKLIRGLVNLFRMPPPRPRSTRTESSPYVPSKQERVVSSIKARQELQRPRHEGGAIMGGTKQFSLFSKPKPAMSNEPVKPVVQDTEIKEKSITEAVETEVKRASKEKPIRPETKQVAQDVWRKYGESSSLAIIDGWKIPPVDILDKAQELEFSEADNKLRAKIIEDALASYGVNSKVVQINVGPTVTQFGVEPGWDIKTRRVQEKDKDGNTVAREEETARTRVKVERITSLANDLALALSAPTIRIEAPVPGKPIVGVEVPNKVYSTVSLRGVVESNGFQKILAKSKLAMALGKGAGGEAISDDLSKMPHLLIAGATGSGKTVCLNAIICCLLMNNTPFDTKMIMIDPKRVELTPFNSLPHLATPVIVDTDKALSTMRWLNMEMDSRYKKLAAAQARNIDGYNKGKIGADKMPNLVLVIDELADLMMAGFDEVEHILCRLAQLARAVGIHLVVATQRPSVDVITGLIKANFPTRISFAVTSQVDSRTILDMVGAEKLLGRGDMLYAPTEAAKPKRLQGCYVSDAEVERLVYFWNGQKRADVTPLKIDEITAAAAASKKEGPAPDPLMETVRQLAEEHKQISASFLQRKLNIGYPRAARLFDKYKEEVESGKDGGAEVSGEES